jgi:hypothetical protein
MLSYIFMKILESRPHRYDWGIDVLTNGQAGKTKEHIVSYHYPRCKTPLSHSLIDPLTTVLSLGIIGLSSLQGF